MELERARKYCSPPAVSGASCCALHVSRDNTSVSQRAVAHTWPGGTRYTQVYLGCFQVVEKCFSDFHPISSKTTALMNVALILLGELQELSSGDFGTQRDLW